MFNGAKLRELRESANLTTYQMAEKLGVSQAMVVYLERGDKQPSVELLSRISERLDVEVADLLKGSGV